MPATATPLFAPADLDAARGGDERAFERLYRATLPGVLAGAREIVPQPGAAHKVAEQVYLRAWATRDRFDRSETFEKALAEYTHDVAVRERARRDAIHRFEAHEKVQLPTNGHAAEPSAEEIWGHITAVLHAPPPDAAALKQRDSMARHETAVHLQQVARRRVSPGLIAGVVVLGVAIAAGLNMMSRGGEIYAINKALAADNARDLRAQTGQRANVTLGDETRVLIGADSKVRVPADFSNTLRGVGVEGAASFTVTRAAGTGIDPFEVRINGLRLIAKGTVFDVRTDAGPQLMLRVREGTVTVAAKRTSSDVAAGRTVMIDSTGNVRDASSAEGGPAFAWADGQYITPVGATVRSVLPDLKRWYRLQFEITDSTILSRPASFSANLESSKEAIAALEQSADVVFGYTKDGETMQLSPRPAAPAKRR